MSIKQRSFGKWAVRWIVSFIAAFLSISISGELLNPFDERFDFFFNMPKADIEFIAALALVAAAFGATSAFVLENIFTKMFRVSYFRSMLAYIILSAFAGVIISYSLISIILRYD